MCNIKDTAFKMLMHQISSYKTFEYTPEITFMLNANPLTHNSIKSIKEGLGNRPFKLYIGSCLNRYTHGTETCPVYIYVQTFLKYMTECLNRSPRCDGVGLGWNKITIEQKVLFATLNKIQ